MHLPNPIIGTLFAIIAVPSAAAAEPISFLFHIQIERRCTIEACEAFDAGFPLTLTTESVGFGSDTAATHERWYSNPVFSPIPLERPSPAPDAMPLYSPAVDMTFWMGGEFGWRRVAHAYNGMELVSGDTTYNWNTSIYRVQDNVWPLPPLTAPNMAEFLGSSRGSGFFGFNYSGVSRGGALTADSIAYIGTATLVPTAPVPEPATCLLVASGVLVLLRRK
jgi:hypothetical protein